MKKENIFVDIDSEEKRLRALQILIDAGEKIDRQSDLFYNINFNDKLVFNKTRDWWFLYINSLGKTEITLDQLEQLLTPNYTVKEVHITIEELKAQAESLGFELVKKERKPKVGDFGAFFDNNKTTLYDFILEIEKDYFVDMDGNMWQNFSNLTEEEKQNIQNNW